jgi:soluble lytic murein transglycosylase-like protein
VKRSISSRFSEVTLDLMGVSVRTRPSRRRRLILWAGVGFAAVGCLLILYFTLQRQAANVREIVRQAALEEGIDPLLAEAVVHAESGGNPRARSRSNAFGLMQLVLSTAGEMAGRPVKEHELYDPRFNARLGCRYLRRLLNLYEGDLLLTLMAYNAGMGRVARWRERESDPEVILEKHAFDETYRYVAKVVGFIRAHRA